MALTKEQHEATYDRIMFFYDFAEQLIATVENPKTVDPAAQLAFIEPLVKKIEDATDVLAEEYREFVQTGKKPGLFKRRRVEKALTSIYQTIEMVKNVQSITHNPTVH